MKLSDISVCAIRLYVIFSVFEVLKQLLDTIIFLGMLPINQLLPSIVVNIIEFAILALLFIFASKITNFVIRSDKEFKNLADKIFRLYIVKITLYLSAVIIIFRSLLSIFTQLSSFWLQITDISHSTPSIHTIFSLAGPQIIGNIIFIILGIFFLAAAIRIDDKK